MALHWFLVLCCLSSFSFYSSSSTNPNCKTTCGNISIPYPFGMGQDPTCFRSEVFRITCNESTALLKEDLEVLTISLNGTLRINVPIGWHCYNESGNEAGYRYHFESGPYTISKTDNKLIAIGCDILTNVTAHSNPNVAISTYGCVSSCPDKGVTSAITGSCTGIGCCQSSIPPYLTGFKVDINRLSNGTSGKSSNPCRYAFLADQDFNLDLSDSDLLGTNFRDRNKKVPVVLDWMADWNANCEVVPERNYACLSKNSNCTDFGEELGYQCRCTDGYEGNPYLDKGCKEIDKCKNTEGSDCCCNSKGFMAYVALAQLLFFEDQGKVTYSCCHRVMGPGGRTTRSSQTQPLPQLSTQPVVASLRVMGPGGRTTRSSQTQMEPQQSTQPGVASLRGVVPSGRTTRSSQMQPEPQPSTQSRVASPRDVAPGGRSASSSAVPSSVPNSSAQSDNVPNSSAQSANGSTPVTKRGKAKNNTLINHIARRGQKPRIEIPPGKSKPVGDWSQQFASEVGIICRKYAPLSLYNWRKVKKEYKSKVQTMHEHILKSFDIDVHLPHVERAINKYLGQRLKEFRCRLHVYYKTLSNDQRRRKPYDNVTQEDWERLCDWFETDKFKKLSTINKAIRAKKTVNHRGGSRSFLNHRADKRDAQTQQEPGRIEFYRMMYFNPGKGWSGSAQENYDKMLELRAESLEEGSTAMTEDEIANKVLGAKPGYIGGLGHGVDPMSSSSSYHYPEVEELRRRAEAAERQAEEYERQAQELTTRLHENEDKVEELQNWKAASEAKLDFLMAHIGANFTVNGSTS